VVATTLAGLAGQPVCLVEMRICRDFRDASCSLEGSHFNHNWCVCPYLFVLAAAYCRRAKTGAAKARRARMLRL